MQFGEQIRKLRTERNMTQEQFAQELHVTRQAVSNWENNRNLPDLEMLLNMSQTFHISLDELMTGGNEMNNMTQKLIQDGSETRKAHDNMITTLVGAFLLIAGIACFIVKANSVEYIDSQGILHENFYLIPIGYLLTVTGGIIFLCFGIRAIISAVKKYRDKEE